MRKLFYKTRERPCGIIIKTRDTDEGKIHVKYEFKYPACNETIPIAYKMDEKA